MTQDKTLFYIFHPNKKLEMHAKPHNTGEIK